MEYHYSQFSRYTAAIGVFINVGKYLFLSSLDKKETSSAYKFIANTFSSIEKLLGSIIARRIKFTFYDCVRQTVSLLQFYAIFSHTLPLKYTFNSFCIIIAFNALLYCFGVFYLLFKPCMILVIFCINNSI